MLQTKIVRGFFRGNQYRKSLEDEINVTIENLERQGFRVRECQLLQPIPAAADGMPGSCKFGDYEGLIGFAAIKYDDSVLYSPNPEEIEDLYHRGEKKATDGYIPAFSGQGAKH